ncbi:MAG: Co2+/Mg2+ efflux protein ApaG [Myxococcota bacterium]|nr:Co2+/Mg2+ efflux protein ApaG [Myxococcota bacterium]
MSAQETSSEQITDGIRVAVRARYSAEHSEPLRNQWFFLYTIRISNESQQDCQLVSRHWIIRDATGHTEEVRGPGVVGEQPQLAPGESFEYTSGCPLPTPFGSMEGLYEMRGPDGASFDARIARFELREESAIH